jgi:hypothetical protein
MDIFVSDSESGSEFEGFGSQWIDHGRHEPWVGLVTPMVSERIAIILWSHP